MDPLSIIHRRLAAQRLTADPFGTPAQAVRWLGAMQAQEYAEAKWSIGQRVHGCTDADVEAAFARGEILRTHLLRPTWHFVTPEDLHWMLALTAPRVHAVNGYSYRRFELDEALLTRSLDVLAGALAGGDPLTRPELADALTRSGIQTQGLRLGYVLMHAELEALICSGPRRGKQHTYALVADRCDDTPALSRDEALARLTLRYFRSRGPATVKDFTTWSGLTVADAKAGLALVEGEIERGLGEDGAAWFAPATATAREHPAGGALLLPMYDEMVMGYRDLKVVLAAPAPQKGLLDRPIVIGGLTVGSWKRTITARAAVIDATLLLPLASGEADALQAAVERFGRFNDRAGVLSAHPADTG